MSARPRIGPPRLAWLVLVVLALPVLLAGVRVVIHFSADFSGPGYGATNTIFADGGVMLVTGPDHVFELGEDAGGDKLLQVLTNPSTSEAALVADLDEPAVDDMLTVDFDIEKAGDWSSLVVWLNDSDGGGMIDIVFSRPDPGQTPIRVGEVPVPLPDLEVGDGRLHVRLTLKQPSLGPASWTMVLTSAVDSSAITGPLFIGNEAPSIGSLIIVRPGVSLGGSYEIDDLVISSQSGGLVGSF